MRIVVLVIALSTSCHGCIAEWRGRSEGTIAVNAGMSLEEAKRRSTVPLGVYGGSDYYFEWVLAGESLRFKANSFYGIDVNNGTVDGFKAFSVNQSWADVRASVVRTEELLLERGWVRNRHTPSMTSLPQGARDAARRTNYDTSIGCATYFKGRRMIELCACGQPESIPWYRFANEPEWFWRRVGVSMLDADDYKLTHH